MVALFRHAVEATQMDDDLGGKVLGKIVVAFYFAISNV